MAKPGKETPGLSEASGSRPVTGFRASMISVEPTVVHSGQQDGDLGSERTTDEQTVEASGGSAPAGDPAEGEGVDAARFAELRLPTPLLAQLDAIAKQECNIQQSLSQEAELRAQISEINKEQQALKREQYKVSGKARDRITERLAVLAEKAKKLGVSADVSQSEATFAHGTSDFDARLASEATFAHGTSTPVSLYVSSRHP
ncbi:hypothetical protein T484DRAFT_1768579 [Baffinella frigidus]|nr:hypothetical protein T484DRAFT_1768579 [Cryptophyta sp. CCMP2293]